MLINNKFISLCSRIVSVLLSPFLFLVVFLQTAENLQYFNEQVDDVEVYIHRALDVIVVGQRLLVTSEDLLRVIDDVGSEQDYRDKGVESVHDLRVHEPADEDHSEECARQHRDALVNHVDVILCIEGVEG